MNNYDYGIIGNCNSAALVSKDCSIEWLCMPFFDSASLFGKILDSEKGGFFKISAVNLKSISQSYQLHTPILKTVFETEEGRFEVRDYMPRFKNERNEYHCPSEVQRNLFILNGKPRIKIELFPRPNYAMSEANYDFRREYLKIMSNRGDYTSFYLYSNLDHKAIVNGDEIELIENSFLLLSYHEKLNRIDYNRIYVDYERTKSYWLSWVFRTRVPDSYKDTIIRSAITLKLLTFQKTGAVIAAPTTSLPEIIGGERNWDYRYCWVRDASMIIDLYARIGHVRSSQRYINFILRRMLLKSSNISVMYGINGETNLEEYTLDHLEGYLGSKPVRVGNAAYLQKQNDVYGELIETIYSYFCVNRRQSFQLDEEIWTTVRSLVNSVIEIWQEPDSGIWEFRGKMEHYVHSKVMSWVALNRAAKISKILGRHEFTAKYWLIAEEIKKDILEMGWSEKRKAFTMYYGSEELDASNLLMLHYGFLSANDERMVSTVRETYDDLVENQFTLRYKAEDDFGKPQNAFVVCTFWMINALYLIGEEAKAREMFQNILKHQNYLGLMGEDVEIKTGRLTGNFPQGYSHLALIQTILLLETNYNWSDAFKFE